MRRVAPVLAWKVDTSRVCSLGVEGDKAIFADITI